MYLVLLDDKRTHTNVKVGGRNRLKVGFTTWPYSMTSSRSIGLTVSPSAVQIIQLVELSGGDDANMFDDEDGFEADASAAAFSDTSTATDEDQLDF